jgi:hypothetical protein
MLVQAWNHNSLFDYLINCFTNCGQSLENTNIINGIQDPLSQKYQDKWSSKVKTGSYFAPLLL